VYENSVIVVRVVAPVQCRSTLSVRADDVLFSSKL